MRKLSPNDLRKECDPSIFPFKTTEDYEFEHEPMHQERGVSAIDFGLNMKAAGFNIYVAGSTGTGRNTQVEKAVNKIAATQKKPEDWVYVNNFQTPDEPLAIKLPTDRGIIFKKDMEELINELKIEIPKAFESEDYETRKHDLIKEYKKTRDETLEDIENRAYKEGFVLKQSATGVILVPRQDDRAMTQEEFEELSDEERESLEKKKHEMHIKIDQVLSEVRALEKLAKNRIKSLEKEVVLFSVKHIIDELRFKYREFEDVVQHLNFVQEDIVDNLDLFKEEEESQGGVFGMKGTPKKDKLLKYEVNLLVDHRHTKGAPVVHEVNPTYYNLIGRIEYVSHFGSMSTDFTMISAGALHKANGGYLVLQAQDVLSNYMAWDALKRVIKNQQIKVEDINEQFRVITTTSLKPRPIPSDIKIIMVGPMWLYELLYKFDEDFRKMFKVKAAFDVEMDRDEEKIRKYAAFMKVRCEEEGLRHFDRRAVSKVIEYGSRLTENQQKLSARFMYVADLLREADYWAGKDHADYVRFEHVEKAIREKNYRSNMVEEKINELISEDIIIIDTDGERVGQVNGLAVYDMGEYMFGKPSRITVRTFLGKAGVVDIERKVDMGGKIHSKGVLILGGFLGGRFAQDKPLTLSASICFEQSYSGVDGDSASSTEAYALLSSLAEIPIRQSVAVTGSINQYGEVQAIGGVNEKIEGFYHVCKVKGFTGEQGVIIPEANVKHLMLKEEVIEAVSKGKFSIWSVSKVDEGIEILTGRKAGIRNKNGKYPRGSVNYLVEKKLKDYNDKLARFGKKPSKKSKTAKKDK